MDTVTTVNISILSFDDVRTYLFSLLRSHEKSLFIDRTLYVELLGEYAAIYQYASELYVFMIGKVRQYAELKESFKKMQAMDKRDCIEQFLKAIKFQYESLSRKVSILSMEDAV